MNKIYIISLLLISIFYFNNTYSSPSELKLYKFKISGKITYKSGDYFIGAEGCKVALYMREKATKIPVKLFAPQDPTSVLNDKGEFKFDLQIQADLHKYDRIILVVVPEGIFGSVHHYEPSYKYLINSSIGTIKAMDAGIGYPVNGLELGFNSEQVQEYNHYIQMAMAPQFGDAVRTLKYAYECTNNMLERLGMDEKMKDIRVNIVKSIESSSPLLKISGVFSQPNRTSVLKDEPAYILLKEKAFPSQSTLSHEYGHYFHYVLNSVHFPKLKSNAVLDKGETNYSKEAIAEFYGRVVRGYISDKSGIPIPHSSNFEKIPFDDPRFGKASYAKYSEYQVPKRASYLWNIYDGPTQINMGKASAGLDNDDIDGGKNNFFKNIFNTIRFSTQTQISNMSTFNELLKAKASDDEMKASIQKIYDCMMGDGSKPMRPVQVQSAILTDIPYTNQRSLKIVVANYLYDLYYANLAQGYNLSAKKDNKWYIIKQLPVGKESPVKEFILKADDIKDYSTFQITAFNQSGNSYAPITFNYKKLNVTMLGPSQIDADKTYMWKSTIEGGQAPYTYQWRVKKASSDNYLNLDPGKSQNDNYVTHAPDGEDFVIDVLVKDKNGVIGYAVKKVSTTILPISVNIKGNYSIGANMEGSWNAVVSGGVPPYDYNWSKVVEGSPQFIYLSQNSTCKTNVGTKSFDLKLVLKDAKNNNAFATQKIVIDQTVPMTVEMAGDKITYLHKPGHWKVNVTGGAVPYTNTLFSKRKEGSNTFSIMQYTTGDNCEETFQEEGVYYLKAAVKGQDNKFTESQEFKVTAIYQPVYATIIKFTRYSKNGAYYVGAEANPEGGKLPYYYQWSFGTTLNNLKSIAGATDSKLEPQKVTTHPGNYILALKVTDAKWKSVTTYMNVTLGDPLGITLPIPQPPVPPSGGITGLIDLTSFPNPSSGTTTIGYELKQASMVNIIIVNAATGARSAIVKERQTAGRHRLTYNLAGLSSGVYEIQVKLTVNNREEIYTSSVVIAK